MEKDERLQTNKPTKRNCMRAKCEFIGQWNVEAVCRFTPGNNKPIMHVIDQMEKCPRGFFMESRKVALEEKEYIKAKAIYDEIHEKDARREADQMTRDESQDWLYCRQRLINSLERMGLKEKDQVFLRKTPC